MRLSHHHPKTFHPTIYPQLPPANSLPPSTTPAVLGRLVPSPTAQEIRLMTSYIYKNPHKSTECRLANQTVTCSQPTYQLCMQFVGHQSSISRVASSAVLLRSWYSVPKVGRASMVLWFIV